MSQEQVVRLIYEQTAAITKLTAHLHTQEAIRRLWRALALKELTLNLARGILAEMAERTPIRSSRHAIKRREPICGRCQMIHRNQRICPLVETLPTSHPKNSLPGDGAYPCPSSSFSVQ